MLLVAPAVRGLGDALRNELIGTGGAPLCRPHYRSILTHQSECMLQWAVRVSVAYPPDTDTPVCSPPELLSLCAFVQGKCAQTIRSGRLFRFACQGFEQENKTKPPETSRISPPEVYPAVRTYSAHFAPVSDRSHTATIVAAHCVCKTYLTVGAESSPSGCGGTVAALVSECWSLPFAIARPSAESSHQLGGWHHPDFR